MAAHSPTCIVSGGRSEEMVMQAAIKCLKQTTQIANEISALRLPGEPVTGAADASWLCIVFRDPSNGAGKRPQRSALPPCTPSLSGLREETLAPECVQA